MRIFRAYQCVRGLNTKLMCFNLYILISQYHIVDISETWLEEKLLKSQLLLRSLQQKRFEFGQSNRTLIAVQLSFQVEPSFLLIVALKMITRRTSQPNANLFASFYAHLPFYSRSQLYQLFFFHPAPPSFIVALISLYSPGLTFLVFAITLLMYLFIYAFS